MPTIHGPSLDPFLTLGLPARFDLTVAQVQAAYLAKSAALHPDVTGDLDESALAALNHAREAVLTPETRADLLLMKLGGPSKESERSLPPGFLPQMLEVREQMEHAQNSKDAAEIANWEAWADERRRGHIAEVAAAFAELAALPDPNDADTVAELRKQIRLELNMWRYTERMIEALRNSMQM